MSHRFSRSFFLLLFIFSFQLLAIPIPTDAGLVPCGRTPNPANVNGDPDPTTPGNEAAPCTVCHLVIGTQGLIQWGLKVMTFIAIAVIVAMAILYIVSAGNEGLMSTAKSGIVSSLVGFAVMLGAWLIVSIVVNTLADTNDPSKPLSQLQSQGTFRFTCDVVSNAGSASGVTVNPGGTGTGPTPGPGGPVVPPGGGAVTPSAACASFESTFASVGASSGINPKLLKAIALKETGGSCNPGLTSQKGACGLMQIKPETARKSCDELKNNPTMSIEIAASYLKQLQGELNAYKSTFDIGNGFDLGSSSVQINGVSYAASNDDLIAAYNAGSGNRMNGSLKGPFMISSDCPGQNGKSIPAWQCPINPGGFTETQNYVRSVQASMK